MKPARIVWSDTLPALVALLALLLLGVAWGAVNRLAVAESILRDARTAPLPDDLCQRIDAFFGEPDDR